MMRFMKEISRRQAFLTLLPPQISHLRNHFFSTCTSPSSLSYHLGIQTWQQRTEIIPLILDSIIKHDSLVNQHLRSAVICRARDQDHPLGKCIQIRTITSEDLILPKARSAQNRLMLHEEIPFPLNRGIATKLPAVHLIRRPQLNDRSVRRLFPEADILYEVPAQRFLNLVKDRHSFVLFNTDFWCLFSCSGRAQSRRPSSTLLSALCPPISYPQASASAPSSLITLCPRSLISSTSIPDLITGLNMAGNQNQQNPNAPTINLDRLFSRDCTMCKAHTVMINSFVKQFNELKEDYEADSRSKRKKLEKQKAEIENLKGRCSHLEEAVQQIRTFTQSHQAETSTRISARGNPQPDDSATQKIS